MKTPPRPERRDAARVLLVDPAGRVLLMQGGDPSAPERAPWWFTPGGGMEPFEDAAAAAVREVREETGLDVAGRLTGPVHRRRAVIPWDGRLLDQHEVYFVAHVDAFEPSNSGWTPLERRSLVRMRWWTLDELRSTTETVYPEALVTLVESVR